MKNTSNVKIKSIGIYHPENKVTNEYYIDHFDNQGKDIRRLLEAYGRDERYIVDNDEDNTVTMGIKASLEALEKANLKGDDIDIILFSCLIPEYTMPPQAIIVHNAIKGKKEALIMDTNIGCVGMIGAMDTAVRYLKTHKNFKRALIIGSDCMSAHCREDDELTYPQFGDLGCAVIIEKTDEDSDFYGSKYVTDSSNWNLVKYPASGNKENYQYDNVYDRKIDWQPFDGNISVEQGANSMKELLSEIDIKVSDVNAFCVSQFAAGIGQNFTSYLGVEKSKAPYVGNKYGYTGTSSPFLALYESIKSGRVKRGDYVGLWSVGVNWTTCALVFKY